MSAFTEDGRFDPFGDLEDDGSEAAYGDLSRSYDDGFDDEDDDQ